MLNILRIFQWGDDQELGLQSNLEWSFDGQVMLKNAIAVTTPFPQLSQVKLEMYNNLESFCCCGSINVQGIITSVIVASTFLFFYPLSLIFRGTQTFAAQHLPETL